MQNVSIEDNGNRLLVPDTGQPHHFELLHPHGGQRVFSRHDVDTGKLVLALHALVEQTRTAVEEGASEERKRIRRDMHDDLGAKLLHLLHKSPADSKPLVREAIVDLRDLLKAMEGHSLSLDAAVNGARKPRVAAGIMTLPCNGMSTSACHTASPPVQRNHAHYS